MMFMSMPEGWHKVVAARGADKQALLERPRVARRRARRVGPHREGHVPHRPHSTSCASSRSSAPRTSAGSGAPSPIVVEERGGHPSDVFADFVLANDCRPGVVAVGMANADIDGVARTLQDPTVLISSSDAGAHMQMMCASGDTTLLLTRHVRERGDFTLEDAVYQLTGRQADVFGFHRRGVIAPGNVADLTVFALDELHYDGDEFVHDLPQGGVRLRRPEGGYRATLVGGTAVQDRRQAHRRAARARHQLDRVADGSSTNMRRQTRRVRVS